MTAAPEQNGKIMTNITYQIIRSNRKTIGIQVSAYGAVTVRAPYPVTNTEIDRFVREHEPWIRKQLKKAEEKQQIRAEVRRLTADEIQDLARQALDVIPKRVAYYAPKIGVTYGRITIRNQKTRWGSCSSKGNLNFNCLLMLTPPEVIDSVVVHELCHRREMNHSARFYEEVLRVFPEYKKWHGWLKEHETELMAQL